MGFGGNIRIRPLTSLLLAGLLACIAPISQALGTGPPRIEEFVTLTDVAQGNICQNSYRPQNSDGLPAAMVLTARTDIDVNGPTDPNAVGSAGSVVLNSDGTGVKATKCGTGGMAIDGTGNGK